MRQPIYRLDDAAQRNRENPSTFYVPGDEDFSALKPGDFCKLIFEAKRNGEGPNAERMWVRVTSVNGGEIRGTLSNTPVFLDDELQHGDEIVFQRCHVADILSKDDES